MPLPARSSVCICTQGQLELNTVFGRVALMRGESLVAGDDQVLRIAVRGVGVLVQGQGHLLRGEEREEAAATHDTLDPPLFTQFHRSDTTLSRIAATLCEAEPGQCARLLDELRSRVAELDAELDPWIARCPGRTRAQQRQAFARFERSRNRARYSHAFDVGELARHTNYTRWHFVRVFSQIYGQSPAGWLEQLRREDCERRLLLPGTSIAQVAAAAGYGSPAAFARWFRTCYGMTASQWREQHGAPPETAAGLAA